MSTFLNNSNPAISNVTPANGVTPGTSIPTGQPVVVQSSGEVGLNIFRNRKTGKTIKTDDGKTIEEYALDPKTGSWLQDPIAPEDAQLHDEVVISGWYDLAMSNPTLAKAKLKAINADLPAGMRIAPRKGAQVDRYLNQMFGVVDKVKLSSNGSYLGWIAEESSSVNPHRRSY